MSFFVGTLRKVVRSVPSGTCRMVRTAVAGDYRPSPESGHNDLLKESSVKRAKRLVPMCLLMFCSVANPAGADVSVPKPVGPTAAVFGPAGSDFPVGKLAAVLNYQYAESDGVRHRASEANEKVKLTKNLGTVKFRYGIMPDLDIRTATPLYYIEKDYKTTGKTDELHWIGDTTLTLHKVLLNQSRNDALSLAVDVGLVVPTTDASSKSLDSIGNNAWGATAGVGVTYALGSHRLDQELAIATFTEGSHDYRKPLRFRSNTSWSHAVNNYFDIGAESLFEWNGESEKSGVKQKDSKNEWYAGPKMAFKYKPAGINVGMLATFPFARWYEGTAPSDGFRFELRLTKVFNLL